MSWFHLSSQRADGRGRRPHSLQTEGVEVVGRPDPSETDGDDLRHYEWTDEEQAKK